MDFATAPAPSSFPMWWELVLEEGRKPIGIIFKDLIWSKAVWMNFFRGWFSIKMLRRCLFLLGLPCRIAVVFFMRFADKLIRSEIPGVRVYELISPIPATFDGRPKGHFALKIYPRRKTLHDGNIFYGQ